MLALGFLRLGAIIKYIPHPVTVGFTSGIAVIIFSSQLVDLIGLDLGQKEPAALLPKLLLIGQSLPSFKSASVIVSAFSILLILGLRRYKPHWPGLLITIVMSGLLGSLLVQAGMPIETIGTKFGGIPNMLPEPHWPVFDQTRIFAVLPDAIAFTLLGSIESLLSAVVADSMSGRRHRSNIELIAQGIGNIGSALFGGICVTGTIARTATNVRAGATSPISGMVHSVILLLLMLVAAPLASYIPLSALAAVLAVVSWNMAEKKEFAALLRHSREDGLVVIATFGLTIFRDLTEGILVGVALGSLFFIRRMAHQMAVDHDMKIPVEWELPPEVLNDDRIALARLNGSFFFGTAADVTSVLERIGSRPQILIVDFGSVSMCDGSAAHAFAAMAIRLHAAGTKILLSGLLPDVAHVLAQEGVTTPVVTLVKDVKEALSVAHQHLQQA
jgi:SulP family sulfate permease